jgi:O-antigen ligase
MHAGIDDLFIILLFLSTVPRVLGRGFPKGPTFKLAGAAVLLNTIACLSNLLVFGPGPGQMGDFIIRQIIKQFLQFACIFCMLESLDTVEECWRLVRWTVYAVVGAGVVIMLSSGFTAVREFFAVAKELQNGPVDPGRFSGSLFSANSAAQILVYGMCLGIILVERARRGRKLLWLIAPLLLLISAAFTESRSGLFSMSLIPAVLLLMQGMRRWAIAYILGILCVPLIVPQFADMLIERVNHIFITVGAESQMSSEAASRIGIWQSFLHSMTPFTLIFGQDAQHAMLRAAARIGSKLMEPHSGYLNLLCYWGIPGVLWGGMLVATQLRLMRNLKLHGGRDGLLWSRAMWLFIVVVLWESISLDSFHPASIGLLFVMAMLAITDRMEAITANESQDQPEFEETEMDAQGLPAYAAAR